MSFPSRARRNDERCLTRESTRRLRGFTLLETLVSISIIATLLSVLLPAVGKVHREMKSLKCVSNLRTVALQFQLFAEGNSAVGQGDSERLGSRSFRINDFQESLYGIDEFWDRGQNSMARVGSNDSPMLCPAGPGQLTKRRGFPCGRRAITPVEDVTLALNMRLYRGVMEVNESPLLAPVRLTKVRVDILNHPYVPLVIDVDGKKAATRRLEPFYTAPPRPGTADPYADGRYWMPSLRHNGKTNVAFVGGHVLSSSEPEEEHWNCDYQGNVGRR